MKPQLRGAMLVGTLAVVLSVPTTSFATGACYVVRQAVGATVGGQYVEPTIEAIIRGGRTGAEGKIGDGKIFILPLDDAIHIRTGERGGEAI